MTRNDFVTLAKKGWEKYGYATERYFDKARFGRPIPETTSCCAIGAATVGLREIWKNKNYDLHDIHNFLYDGQIDYVDIMKLSDDAGSKEAAIAALEAWAA